MGSRSFGGSVGRPGISNSAAFGTGVTGSGFSGIVLLKEIVNDFDADDDPETELVTLPDAELTNDSDREGDVESVDDEESDSVADNVAQKQQNQRVVLGGERCDYPTARKCWKCGFAGRQK